MWTGRRIGGPEGGHPGSGPGRGEPLLRDHGDQQRSLGRGRCQAEGHAAGRGVQRPGVCGLRTGQPCTDPSHFSNYSSGDAVSVGMLVSGSSRTVQLIVDVDADVPDGRPVQHGVVSRYRDDPYPANNSSTEDTSRHRGESVDREE